MEYFNEKDEAVDNNGDEKAAIKTTWASFTP